MIQHLANHFAEVAAICGEEGLTKIVDDALPRIQSYGLHSNYQACIFIDLAMMLGRGFDTDPLLPWMQQLMQQKEENKTLWMEKIMGVTHKYRKQALGDEPMPSAAYKKIIEREYDDVEDVLKPLSREGVLSYLEELWPEKFALIDETGFTQLYAKSAQKASHYSVESKAGIDYFTMLTFLLGSDFDRDFQYEWLMNILNDPAYDEEYYKLCSLHFTVQEYFKALLEEPIM
jgi:hypothetical protein